MKSQGDREGDLVRIPLINLSSHGGVRILVELANALSRAGLRVEILIPPGKNGSFYRLDEAVVVREIGFGVGSKFIDYALFLMILPLYLRHCLVVANFFVTYLPCRLGAYLGRSSFLYLVQDIENKYTGFVGGILNKVCELSYRSRCIVTANAYLASVLRERGHQVLESINIGPTERFYKLPLNSGERKYKLMYMPRHEAWKRMDRFEAICRLLPDVHPSEILCVGQDDEILGRLAKKGYAVCKPRNDAELVDCYDQARVFLLTSDREGFGLPPLEAMARGVPVVSFRCGGPGLYIEDGVNSFLVDEVDQAVERVQLLLSDTLEHARLALAGRGTAKCFKLSEGLARFVDRARMELERTVPSRAG